MEKRIIEELEKRFFGSYTLNSVIEPIEIGSVVLQPVLVVKWTHAGYFVKGHKFSEQPIEEIEKFKWEKEEDNIYMSIDFKDGILTMVVQEEYENDNIQWIEVRFAIIKKE